MSKPLAMNMYTQNSSGVWVPISIFNPAAVNIQAYGGVGVSSSAPADGLSPPGSLGEYLTFAELFNGATWDQIRTPKVFKTATATATGNTAVWTPTSGKHFRLMKYVIYVTSNAAAAAAGVLEITFQDATTAIGLGFSSFTPSAAGTTFVDSNSSGLVDLGNGFLSAAINNVLNVNLSFALTAGEVRVVAIGTEE